MKHGSAVLLQDIASPDWSPEASSASWLSWTLQTQVCLLPPLPCCAIPSCLALGMGSLPVHAPTCSLIIHFIDVHVRAVLAAKASRMKETWMLREVCLLLCHTIAGTLGRKRMALHGMLQLSLELVTHATIKLSWICDRSFSGACFHGSGAVFLQLPHFVFWALVSSRSVPCLCKSVRFPGVTAPARDSSTHRISPLCSSSTEPAFCFIHKITTALIQFGHFTCLQAEPTARQVLTPREVKLSKLGKPCIILKLLSLLHSYINAHTHTHAHTHNRELIIPSSHSSILRSKQFSEPILPFPLHYHHTGVPCTFSSCKHKLISPAQTLPLNPADEVSYKK